MRFFSIIAFLLFGINSGLLAQKFQFSFRYENTAYQEIDTGLAIVVMDTNNYCLERKRHLPFPKSFRFGDTIANHFNINSFGSLSTYHVNPASEIVQISALKTLHCRDGFTDGIFSKIHYQYDTNKDQLIVEYQNMATLYDGSDRINMQVAFDFSNEEICIHFGEIDVADWSKIDAFYKVSNPPNDTTYYYPHTELWHGASKNLSINNSYIIVFNEGNSYKSDTINPSHRFPWQDVNDRYLGFHKTQIATGTKFIFGKDNPSGIAASTSKTELNIFPNPSNGNFQIEGLNPMAEVNIFDLSTGKSVSFKRNGENIQLNQYTKGIYLLRINQNDTIQNLKIITQ